jgi:DNA polymerase phi
MVRLEVPGHVLQHFWDLANIDAETRRESAVNLVNELKQAQDEHVPGGADDGTLMGGGGGGDANGVVDGPALEGCSPVLVYALKRLARGLGSGRSGARQGFALALTAAFTEIPLVSLPDGLKLLKSSLEPITQSTKGAEARDILMGQLFGIAALVRAMAARFKGGDLTLESVLSFGAAVAEETAKLAASKAYLAESAAAVVLELKAALGPGMGKMFDRSPALTSWITTPASKAGPEVVQLCMELWPYMPKSIKDQCECVPQGGVKAKDWTAVFQRDRVETVRDALMESSYVHPRVHSVWDGLITHAVEVPGAVETLWDVACENGLFVSGSHQRRYLGFRLFNTLLPLCEPEAVPSLFSDGFIRCLLNNLNKEENYLHAAAEECLDSVVAYARAKDTPQQKRLSVIAALQRLGPSRFDKVSKRNAVRELIGGLSVDDASGYMRELMGIFVAPPADVAKRTEGAPGGELVGNKRRLWALEQAVGLWPKLPAASQATLVKFLVTHAFYRADGAAANAAAAPKKGKKKSSGGLVEEAGVAPLAEPLDGLREACAVRVSSLLEKNLKAQRAAAAGKEDKPAEKKPAKKGKKGKKADEDEDTDGDAAAAKEPPADLLSVAADLCRAMDAAGSGGTLVDDMPRECADVRGALFAALDKVKDLSLAGEKAEDAGAAAAAAVAPLLRVLAVLQLGDWREFTPAIEDLPRCVDDLVNPPEVKKPAKKGKKSKKDEEEDSEEEETPKPMDVLVDILLSLLAQPSALLRDVVEHTFKAVAPAVSEASVVDMLRVVMARDADNRNAGGEGSDDENGGPLGEHDEDEEDGEEDEEDGDSDSDSDEAPGANGAAANAVDLDFGGSDSESGDESEDEDDTPLDEKKAAAIKAALVKAGALKENEDDESDSDSDPADGMDDEAMFGIDKLLGRAFKSQREDINRKKNLVRATRDFKFRVLSLLELYAKCQPASPYLPGAALPLLGAMQDALVAGTPQSAALAERIGGVLTKSVCHAKDLPTGAGAEPVDADSIAGELKLAIRAAAKPAGAGGDAKGFAKPATAVAMYLLRVLEAVSRLEKKSGEDEASPDAVSAYRDALEAFRTNKRCRIKAPFFQSAFERHPPLAAALLPELAALLNAGADKESSRGEYLRAEGAKLLTNALSLGRRRSPAVGVAASTHRAVIGSALAAAVRAPCRNNAARAETAKLAVQCMEALGRLSPDAPLSTVLDADDILGAVTKQFAVPGMPPKGVSALTRACTLLGKVAPEAVPGEPKEPKENKGAGDKKKVGKKEGGKGEKRKGPDGAKEKGGKKKKAKKMKKAA